MNLSRPGGRCRFLLGGTLVGALSWGGLGVSAQENPAPAAPPPAAASPTKPATVEKSSSPKTMATPRTAPVPPKRSLAPRPRGETPPALAASPGARGAGSTTTSVPNGTSPATPGGDGTEGSEPLVLDKMTVTEEQSNLPAKAQVVDPKERLKQALKANPGLGIGGPLAKLNYALALEMQKESKEAAARAALTQHVENLPAMDEERAKEEVRLMREATARPNNDWRQRR